MKALLTCSYRFALENTYRFRQAYKEKRFYCIYSIKSKLLSFSITTLELFNGTTSAIKTCKMHEGLLHLFLPPSLSVSVSVSFYLPSWFIQIWCVVATNAYSYSNNKTTRNPFAPLIVYSLDRSLSFL